MIPGSIIDWFSGDGRYMRLRGCMGTDYVWIWITVALDFAVAAGYVLIARHWWVNARQLPPSPAKRALSQMRNIFVFCGICGYIFIPIKMVWPAWRLFRGIHRRGRLPDMKRGRAMISATVVGLVLLFVASGTMMISRTLRIPKL